MSNDLPPKPGVVYEFDMAALEVSHILQEAQDKFNHLRDWCGESLEIRNRIKKAGLDPDAVAAYYAGCAERAEVLRKQHEVQTFGPRMPVPPALNDVWRHQHGRGGVNPGAPKIGREG